MEPLNLEAAVSRPSPFSDIVDSKILRVAFIVHSTRKEGVW
jgi:hypothetical protein